MQGAPSSSRTALFTAIALFAFAANSLLCRAALGPRTIDAASFTFVRIASGAVTLGVLARLRARAGGAPGKRDLVSPVALFAYAIAFSLAYLHLSTGTGALILFGCVQVTMIAVGVRQGERPRPSVWIAIGVAVCGLVGITLPGLDAPDPRAALLMGLSGVAWGVYSLRGRGGSDPLGATARNFAWSVPLSLVAFAIALATGAHAEGRGVLLAAASGAMASGIGYAIWYTALRGLTTTRAAVVQLSVPVIAAAGGVIILGEAVSTRLLISAAAILGGVAYVAVRR